ncbi:hypothetical protein [Methylobacterium sp. 391_Methyba4]|uniref:hypothetical protein n=1 Tax=Methylobacterium sp. 391_Methyba4 TaxID=3038924 RepID=UPI0024200322|nr:hypothetical protein [Methylobacterium sp. 391_Methyba4]WFS07759.1 hypothetical protein P9K36_00180 [Methylobacterium sp. 391_Methyba4]
MTALSIRGSADWLRSRRAQAAQARRQAEHHRRLAEIWDAQAAEFEADVSFAVPSEDPGSVAAALEDAAADAGPARADICRRLAAVLRAPGFGEVRS